MNIIPSLSAAAILLISGMLGQVAEARTGYKIGQTLPNFRAVDQYGRSVSMRSLRGQNLVIEFAATWCEPSQVMAKSVPGILANLRANGKPTQYVTILVESFGGTAAHVSEAAKWELEYGLSSPVLHSNDKDTELYRLLNLATRFARANTDTSGGQYPTTVFADANQKILDVVVGFQEPVDVQAEFAPGLPAPAAVEPPGELAVTRYDLSATVGTGTGTSEDITEKLYQTPFDSGTLPDGYRADADFSSSLLECGVTVGVAVDRTQFPGLQLPHNEAISFRVSDMKWATPYAGLPYWPLVPVTFFTFETVTTEEGTFIYPKEAYSAYLPASAQSDGSVIVEPFTLEEVGVPADAQIGRVTAEIPFSYPQPNGLLADLQMRITPPRSWVNLKPKTLTRWCVPLQLARAELAPGGDRGKALVALARFLELVASCQGSDLSVYDRLWVMEAAYLAYANLLLE